MEEQEKSAKEVGEIATAYSILMNKLQSIDSELLKSSNSIEHERCCQDQRRALEKLKSVRTYLEFSLFMDYELKKLFLADKGDNANRYELIVKIKQRNGIYLKHCCPAKGQEKSPKSQ